MTSVPGDDEQPLVEHIKELRRRMLFAVIPIIVITLVVFMFVGKGLYMNEKKFFIWILPLSFVLFFAGAALAYFIVVPIVFKSAMVYSMDIAVPQNRALKIFYSIMTLVVSFGIFFQFPLLILSALKINTDFRRPFNRHN
jgi:sec-independent protein translocase protein TatC